MCAAFRCHFRREGTPAGMHGRGGVMAWQGLPAIVSEPHRMPCNSITSVQYALDDVAGTPRPPALRVGWRGCGRRRSGRAPRGWCCWRYCHTPCTRGTGDGGPRVSHVIPLVSIITHSLIENEQNGDIRSYSTCPCPCPPRPRERWQVQAAGCDVGSTVPAALGAGRRARGRAHHPLADR